MCSVNVCVRIFLLLAILRDFYSLIKLCEFRCGTSDECIHVVLWIVISFRSYLDFSFHLLSYKFLLLSLRNSRDHEDFLYELMRNKYVDSKVLQKY